MDLISIYSKNGIFPYVSVRFPDLPDPGQYTTQFLSLLSPDVLRKRWELDFAPSKKELICPVSFVAFQMTIDLLEGKTQWEDIQMDENRKEIKEEILKLTDQWLIPTPVSWFCGISSQLRQKWKYVCDYLSSSELSPIHTYPNPNKRCIWSIDYLNSNKLATGDRTGLLQFQEKDKETKSNSFQAADLPIFSIKRTQIGDLFLECGNSSRKYYLYLAETNKVIPFQSKHMNNATRANLINNSNKAELLSKKNNNNNVETVFIIDIYSDEITEINDLSLIKENSGTCRIVKGSREISIPNFNIYRNWPEQPILITIQDQFSRMSMWDKRTLLSIQKNIKLESNNDRCSFYCAFFTERSPYLMALPGDVGTLWLLDSRMLKPWSVFTGIMGPNDATNLPGSYQVAIVGTKNKGQQNVYLFDI